MAQRYQNIVIGGGHNGLVCAAYLARAGKSVVVLEAANEVGGAAKTRNLGSHAKVSAGAHLLHSMPADLIRDLNLDTLGLNFAATAMDSISLNDNGPCIVFREGRVEGDSLSDKDQAAYVRFQTDMNRFATALRPVFNDLAPELSIETWSQRFTLLGLGLRVRKLGKFHMRELLRIIAMNLYDLLDEYFESPQLKAAIALDALWGSEWGPRSMGSVLTYLNRLAGYARGKGMGIAQPAGGMGSVTQSLAKAAHAAGAEIRTGARVTKITIEKDRVTGVELADGEVISGENVISNADPKQTFMTLVSADHLDTGFVRQIRNLRSKGRSAKLHLVLNGAPKFKGVAATDLGSRFLIATSPDDIELAFNPCKYGKYPKAPVWEITIPSIHDSSMAGSEQHVLSAILQYVPYDDSPAEDANREAFLQTVLGQLERYAPGIGQQVVTAELLTPHDIEREFGMSGGHWHHVELALESFLFNRPTPVLSRHSSPIDGLYLCGAGCHPGGNIMGIAGRNAAQQVIRGGR